MPVTIARRTRSSFAVAAALALALSACSPSNGSDESPSDQSTPSASKTSSASSSASSKAASPTSKSAAPTPVAASSEGPAKNWPVPTLPEAAKEHSLKGAGAFAKYYFDLIEYTTWTNDSKPLEAASTSSCVVCNENIIKPAELNRGAGGWNVGGAYHPTIASAQNDSQNTVWVTFKFTQDGRNVYNSDGELSTEFAASKTPRVGSFTLVWRNGWKLDSVDLTAS